MNLGAVCSNAMSVDSMPQIGDLILGRSTLGKLDVPVIFL